MRERELSDTLKDQRETGSSGAILEAITEAQKAIGPYLQYCQTVDKVYSLSLSSASAGVYDETFALFWASMEILKPAIYAKPPKPVATPRFKDGRKLEKLTAELMERCLESTFDRGGIDDVMLGVRDDLALTNRGVGWATYETDAKGGGQRVCLEHLDRTDFLHEPARKWVDVGWVARRAWMTKTELKKRFNGIADDVVSVANFSDRKDKDDYGMHDSSAKAGVWEVWSKADDKVYWVTEGVQTILDESSPHLNLSGFFPCPRPAYGTLQRRSLNPVPDYKRYHYHLDQINKLTERIYVLLEKVKLKVLIPAGGEVADAVDLALNSSDDSITIPVPMAALSATGQSNLFVTLPLADIAATIKGLIDARSQLINDFYQLSGISDIMRGATEAQETLGAQQLKSQYGSVRVRDKIDELQRVARDLASIAAEIIAANFSKETLLELSQMIIPDKAEIEHRIKAVPKEAEDEVKALRESIADQAEAQAGEIDPQQVQAAFMEQKQAIMQKYDMLLTELTSTVTMDDVMKALRDTRARNLVMEIETDSTILTDEIAEKQSRAEFLNAFSGAATATASLLAAGEPGAKLAGGMLKFALQPYRASRELDGLIDAFVENAPNIPQQGGDETATAIAEANQKIAEAELGQAQAAIKKVEVEAQAKAFELQQKQQQAETDVQADSARFQLELQDSQGRIAKTQADIDLIRAQIEKMGVDASNQSRQQEREDVKTVSQIEGQQQDRAISAEQRAADNALADRQQLLTETERQEPPNV